MSIIPSSYPVFQNNQVLTSSNLNDSFNYLDMQNRITRTNLIGIGIVCGFEISYLLGEGGLEKITISEGTGITSEGFLINACDCATSYFRPYTPPLTPEYANFQGKQMYELLSALSQPPADDEKPLTDFNVDGEIFRMIDDYCIILLLEIFDEDLKSCLGNSCDEIGKTRKFTVRKLLITKSDLDSLMPPYSNVPGLYYDKYFLPEVHLPRPLFQPGTEISYEDFAARYVTAFTGTFYELFGNGTSQGVLAQSYEAYSELLGPFFNNNPFGGTDAGIVTIIQNLVNYFEDIQPTGYSFLGIQYLYDFVKDLILAYCEFKETAYKLMTACCPSRDIFPYHLMLGEVIGQTTLPPSKRRHAFSQPPIYQYQKYLLENSISLFKKMVLMVESFDLNTLNNPDTNAPVRITPSREKLQKFSARSIPYYYKVDTGLELTDIEKEWSYDEYLKSFPSGSDVLSYYRNTNTGTYVHRSYPLLFDLDPYSFFRIEGYLGKNCATAIQEIRAIRDAFNLPVEVIALSLYSPLCDSGFNNECCVLGDLEAEYATIRIEVISILRTAAIYYRAYNGDGETTDRTSRLKDIPAAGGLTRVNRSINVTNELEKELLNKFSQRRVNASRDYNVNMWYINEELLEKILPPALSDFKFEAFPQEDGFFYWYENFALEAQEMISNYRYIIKWYIESSGQDWSVEFYVALLQQYSELFRAMDQLVFNYSYKKLQWLYESYKSRTSWLAENSLSRFPNFIRQHPGTEHKAGVQPGGTFILLYQGVQNTYYGGNGGIGADLIYPDQLLISNTQIFADFSLPYRVTLNNNNPELPDPVYDEADIPVNPDFSWPSYKTPYSSFVRLEKD